MVGVCFRNGWAVLWLVVLLRVVRSSFFIPRANYPLIIIMHPPYFFIFNFFCLHYFCSLWLLYYLICLRLSLLLQICWIAKLLSCWAAELLICWSAHLLICGSADMLSCWFTDLLICWSGAADLLFCWSAVLLIWWSAGLLLKCGDLLICCSKMP